ncbi:hypothetical protein L198_04100 [Cryptococcus wingfieldii CBS 7118]|uniref:Uncharacterized protein n=1 Tax=Cryptococcus wingfieldii CBS 7118 TaxID=1295528 RepID=A0A1E3J8H3_9TREE|nr:hypothetical protein L198_04100 [Cryptococcus wingfieldii CBS 7118]ODN96386.1 hypothetical protein L198_04100 [Cryptococcus wingfieldii CBS 7118]
MFPYTRTAHVHSPSFCPDPCQPFLSSDTAYEQAFNEEIQGILWRMESSKGSGEALSTLPLPLPDTTSSPFRFSPLLSRQPTFSHVEPSPSQPTSDIFSIPTEVDAFLDIIEDDASPTPYWGAMEAGALSTRSQPLMPCLVSSSSRAEAMPTCNRRHSSAHVNPPHLGPSPSFVSIPAPSSSFDRSRTVPHSHSRTIYSSTQATLGDSFIPRSRRFSAPDISNDVLWGASGGLTEKPIKRGDLKVRNEQQEKQVKKERKRMKAAALAAEKERVRAKKILDLSYAPREKQGPEQGKDKAAIATKRFVDSEHPAPPKTDSITVKLLVVREETKGSLKLGSKKTSSGTSQQIRKVTVKSLATLHAPSPSPFFAPSTSDSSQKKRHRPKSAEREIEDESKSQPPGKKPKCHGTLDRGKKGVIPVVGMMRYSAEEDQMILQSWDGRPPLSADTLTRMQTSMAMNGHPPRSIAALKYRAHHNLKPQFDEKRLALAAKRGRR